VFPSVDVFCWQNSLLFDLLWIHIHHKTIHNHRIYQVSIGTLVTYKLLATLPGKVGNPHVHGFGFGEREKKKSAK